MPFPLAPKFLDDLEEELGASLPEAYREAMLATNGGERAFASDSWILHPIKDTSDRKRIKRTCNHVLLETQNRTEWSEAWPEGALEIAHNGSGDCLFFPKNGTQMGPEVCVWNHETNQYKIAKQDFADLKG